MNTTHRDPPHSIRARPAYGAPGTEHALGKAVIHVANG